MGSSSPFVSRILITWMGSRGVLSDKSLVQNTTPCKEASVAAAESLEKTLSYGFHSTIGDNSPLLQLGVA